MSFTISDAIEKARDMDASLQPLAEVYPERLPCRPVEGLA
jgi:hypothetical protein